MFRNENEFVRWLRGFVPRPAGRLKLGIGDDAALAEVSRGRELILTTDLSIEGVHFTRRLHPPRSVGHRALARSLSDIAAMGGIPRFALVSLAISRGSGRGWIEGLYAGIVALARRFSLSVIGGDTAVVRGSTIIDVVVVGEVPPGSALLRSGARPGDQLFVSGTLGLSALGLRLLKSRPRRLSTSANRAIQAHLSPEPRCALGRFLSERRLARALIDVSDGLSTDLSHLCEASGVGARVWANRIPVPKFPDARGQAPRNIEKARPFDCSLRAVSEVEPRAVSDGDLLELALHGGEDYELLFTVPPRKAARVPARFRGVPLCCIGEIHRSKELLLIRPDGMESTLRPSGYDHFRKRN